MSHLEEHSDFLNVILSHGDDARSGKFSETGLGQASCAGNNSSRPQWCPRCSTLFTPSSTYWRTLTAKMLRSKRRRGSHGDRRGIYWLDKPLPKHSSYVVVDCRTCGGSFVAGGLNKPSSKRKHSSIENSKASVMTFKAPLTAKAVASSPTAVALSTPKERSTIPSNRGRSGSTPSNRHWRQQQQHRRSSTLKAQLARSSSQQRHRHGQRNSPKLSAFLTSVQ